MRLIVGLGNPGKKYAETRHNVGFMAVDSLAEKIEGSFRKKFRAESLVAQAQIAGEKLILAKPQTFMNLSGGAVRFLLKQNGLSTKELIVVADEIDLPLGEIRLRERGSAGGHNGLRSVIESLETEDFPRIRIGVCGERGDQQTAEYVLSRFWVEELKVIKEVTNVFNQMIHCVIEEGISKAMSLYNKRI